MGTYQYAAKDAAGKTIQGSIQATSQGEAVEQLRRQDLTILQVQEAGKKGKKAKKPKRGQTTDSGAVAKGGGGLGSMKLFQVKPNCKPHELVLFTRQLATMIGAGISLLESLEVLEEQADSPGMKACCVKVNGELRGGSDLSAAMATCPKVFDHLYVSMVTAGEASGQMDVILDRLAAYTEASQELKREIRSAMTYPVISLVLVLGITVFLMVGVVPGFKDVFDGLGAELPALTLGVLAVSEWMQNSWLMIIAGMFGMIFAFTAFKRTAKGALILDHIALHVPVFGALTRKVALARFSRTFSTLIRSGVPIMGTLDIVADTAGNLVISNVVKEARESVRTGNMLSEPLGRSKVFPPMVVRMIAIGERSGALETLLEKIAEFYDSEVKATIKALTSLIEPMLICFMGGIVGVVIMAVFLPLLNIIGEING